MSVCFLSVFSVFCQLFRSKLCFISVLRCLFDSSFIYRIRCRLSFSIGCLWLGRRAAMIIYSCVILQNVSPLFIEYCRLSFSIWCLWLRRYTAMIIFSFVIFWNECEFYQCFLSVLSVISIKDLFQFFDVYLIALLFIEYSADWVFLLDVCG